MKACLAGVAFLERHDIQDPYTLLAYQFLHDLMQASREECEIIPT